jgi:hypothetical protein
MQKLTKMSGSKRQKLIENVNHQSLLKISALGTMQKLTKMSDKNINHAEAHQNVRTEKNATHALTSRTHQAPPGTPHDNADLYEDRKAHQALSRRRNQKTSPSKINYPVLQPPLTQLQHVSPMVAALQEELYVMVSMLYRNWLHYQEDALLGQRN